MCGIIAVLRRRSDRTPPSAAELTTLLEGGAEALAGASTADLVGVLGDLGTRAEEVDRLLRGTPGVSALLTDRGLGSAIEGATGGWAAALAEREACIDEADFGSATLEQLNAAIIRLKDALWSIQRDRLRTASAVADLVRPHAGRAAVEALTSVQAALSAIDRLEVRGRDSAGLTLLVS